MHIDGNIKRVPVDGIIGIVINVRHCTGVKDILGSTWFTNRILRIKQFPFFFFQITKKNKRWREIRRSIAQLPEIRPDNGIIYGSFN